MFHALITWKMSRKPADLVVTPIEQTKARITNWYIQSQHTQADITSSTANRVITACLSNFRPEPSTMVMTSWIDCTQQAVHQIEK